MGIHGKRIIIIIMVLYKTPLQLQLELIVQHLILWQKKSADNVQVSAAMHESSIQQGARGEDI